ncbi:ATP-binding protein [Bacteroides fragilis]|uniref:AAA family ATPase n=1 Tax=Bacteroides fragilis TaxID=817 RepID=UPI0020308999|nr:ATP-binding protein [Bacteroides fragilis]MCM0343102.1 ATP-binding protein [Bacteroides fragilis]
MKSPFQYGTLVDKENFVNRVEERKQLKEWLGSGINVMLISPRRWGKSSLVKVAMDELMHEDKQVRVCYIDAFSIKTESEFYRTFAREVIACAASTLEKRLEDVGHFLKAVSPSITLKSTPANTMSFDLKFELEERDVMEILELPEKIAIAKSIRVIVCIDEFQQLAQLPGYRDLEGKMRSVWQKQQQVSYCFYGSKRHMMLDIFNNSSNPFYRFGQVLFLQKIKKEEWVPFIVNAFKRTNKEISKEQAEQLCDIVKCHSWYLQQLCYFVWSGTSDKVTDEIIEMRTRQLIDTNMPMFMNDTENLTAAQTAMLRAVANGEYRFNSIPVVRKYELGSAQAITRNKRMLTERDFIEKEGELYVFSDPVFELWFKREYC